MDQTHPAIAKRLLRANGHLARIIEMFGEGRSCLELAQQLEAVEKAIDNAKKALIHDHIDHCLTESLGSRLNQRSKKMVDEFRDITRYLQAQVPVAQVPEASPGFRAQPRHRQPGRRGLAKPDSDAVSGQEQGQESTDESRPDAGHDGGPDFPHARKIVVISQHTL